MSNRARPTIFRQQDYPQHRTKAKASGMCAIFQAIRVLKAEAEVEQDPQTRQAVEAFILIMGRLTMHRKRKSNFVNKGSMSFYN